MKKQQGFALKIILIISFTLGLIGAIAFFYVNRAADQKPSTQSTTPAVSDSAKKKAATEVVKKVYTYYLARQESGITITDPILNADFTDSLKSVMKNWDKTSTVGSYDPIFCAQNTPASLNYSDATLSGQTALVKIASTYSKGGITILNVTVDTISNKIATINCNLKQ